MFLKFEQFTPLENLKMQNNPKSKGFWIFDLLLYLISIYKGRTHEVVKIYSRLLIKCAVYNQNQHILTMYFLGSSREIKKNCNSKTKLRVYFCSSKSVYEDRQRIN